MREISKVIRCSLSLFICLSLFAVQGKAQATYIYGNVKETFSQVPLPFVHIIINEGSQHSFADANGQFDITLNQPLYKLEFTLPLHRSLVYMPAPEEQTDSLRLEVNLNRNKLLLFETKTDSAATKLMHKVLRNKQANSPQLRRNFSYDSYNKLTISTENLAETKNELQKLLSFFSINLNAYDKNHHLFLMESATHRRYLNKLNQKEIVLGARASGLDHPSLLTLASLWQPFSIYENYLSIAGDAYISPLAGNALNRYQFTIVDQAIVGQDTVYVVQYNPEDRRKLDKLTGLLYINSRNYAVQYATASPATTSAFNIGIMQEYHLQEDSSWFPAITKAQFEYAFVASSSIRLIATSQNHISNINFHNSLRATDFDEVAIDYTPNSSQRDSIFWNKRRQTPVSQTDLNTFAFYNSLGTIKNFQRLLKSGHQLYYGHIPINAVTIDLNRVLTFNEYEGIRAGFGAYTNNQLSRNFSLGGYYGHGFRDKDSKYGANVSLLLSNALKLQVHGSLYRDLAEPGAVNFAFDKVQYSAEPLRKYRLSRMDRVLVKEAALSLQPFRNLYLQTGLSRRIHELPYNYQFNEKNDPVYQFTEIISSLRYSFGERFIRSERDLYSLGTAYPEFWLQYTQGTPMLFNGEFRYKKLDFKVQQNLRILGFGRVGWQLMGGLSKGKLPYSVLYNAKGSLKDASIVTHNSFETMNYNEFLSDRYIALFYAHSFGRIYERSSVFRPTLEMLHNMGFGWLRNREQHYMLDFKTMEKGYFETGFFTNDLFVANLAGLKVGIGAGLFLRYGPYALSSFNDNLMFKLATNFKL